MINITLHTTSDILTFHEINIISLSLVCVVELKMFAS
jgi:hypothetical protein